MFCWKLPSKNIPYQPIPHESSGIPLVVRDISIHFPNISLKECVLYVIIKVTYFVEKKGQVITMKKIISTTDAPAAIGPYSQAIEINGFLFTSGVLPIVPSTGELVTGGIEAQAEQALGNLAALIHASGARIEDTIKTTVFIKNMDDFAAVNDIYAKYFTQDFPARACVEVARLPKDVLSEIEAIVEKKGTV